ncbi:uncharacterized protein EKO05_0005079 [Ascochyta rabiei]|uniref:Uncharacterized protein n=1 Tax=Didymella rabiei TaxID=5454 RepID=A0A163BT20_DIDRA|nr:uncharacterized protein EKO05_0005079 [Ascochyta rabiei]KZM21962.1 hypothetical protein ST47_g6896 [Ascochyta rabiei]UPX14601.1 hypothetical protein EKO05_0005079 [Ascochyta rabiei]
MATHDSLIPQPKPLGEAPRDLATIAAQETAHTLPYWNATVAFELGIALRTRLLSFNKPAVVHISTIHTPAHVLFHSATRAGTTPDNDVWVARKRSAVVRWQVSTWQLHNRFAGDEQQFAVKMGLGERAAEYAIHGGGVPVFVQGVEGPVAVVVVSGLKQWDDHQVIIEELEGLVQGLQRKG